MFPISLKNLNDQQKHDYILQTFVLNKQNSAENRKHKRDIDVIRENHKFLWNDEDEATISDSWEVRLAKRYYDKLFKEYCIADLSRHQENKVALRWRTQAEVVAGIGQFQCGSRKCTERDGLRSWEVNFAYMEHGERKNALVKLRLCEVHSKQLNYTSQKREVKRLKKSEKQKAKDLRKEKKHKKKKHSRDDRKYSNSDEECKDKTEESLEAIETPKEKEYEDTMEEATHEEDVWSKKPEMELEQNCRENDFERYLEDLLL